MNLSREIRIDKLIARKLTDGRFVDSVFDLGLRQGLRERCYDSVYVEVHYRVWLAEATHPPSLFSPPPTPCRWRIKSVVASRFCFVGNQFITRYSLPHPRVQSWLKVDTLLSSFLVMRSTFHPTLHLSFSSLQPILDRNRNSTKSGCPYSAARNLPTRASEAPRLTSQPP